MCVWGGGPDPLYSLWICAWCFTGRPIDAETVCWLDTSKHLNGVLPAGRCRPDTVCSLGSYDECNINVLPACKLACFFFVYKFVFLINVQKLNKDQLSIQSSTTHDLRHHMRSKKQ